MTPPTRSADQGRRFPGPHFILLAAVALVGLGPPGARADQPPATAPAVPAQPDASTAPVPPPPDHDDLREVLIIQALDQPTRLNVQDIPIRQALDQLAADTGIPIQLAPPCLTLLPYGSQTRLSATIQDRPLRESLDALLRPLGLRFAPTPRELLIYPAPPLARSASPGTSDARARVLQHASSNK